MSKTITIIRIDSEKRHILRLSIKRSIPAIRHAIRARDAEYEHVLDVDGNPLLCAFDSSRPKTGPGFRFRGGKAYYGICLLVGLHKGRAISAPVDLEWANKRITWLLDD